MYTAIVSYTQIIPVKPLSSPLLLRNIPQIFANHSIIDMCLSSRKRSNFKAFRRISPQYAPVHEGLNYSKTGVPWQMNNIFIIVA